MVIFMINIKLLDDITKYYVLFRSPLQSKKGQTTLFIIALALILIAIPGWMVIISKGGLLSIWTWVPYTIAGSLIAYLIISFFDRKRGIRQFHFLVILSVILITAPIAALINDHSPAKLVTVGFNEEFFKILPVLLLAVFLPNLIRTRKDGIIYGAMAGIGFNVIEIALYIIIAQKDHTIMEALWMHSTRFAIFGFGSHVIWSAFAGLGIGIAMQTQKMGWRKWIWAVVCYLMVAVAHSMYDLGASMIGTIIAIVFFGALQNINLDELMSNINWTTDIYKPGIVRDAMKADHFIYNIGFILILIWQLIKSLKQEQKIYIDQLSTEDSSIVSSDEMDLIKTEGILTLRKYGRYPKKEAKRIVRYQNLLAMLKDYASKLNMSPDKAEEIGVIRRGIVGAKQQL
jgi:RsiW-degrading membrane proteinase PrsW (M82 family)